MSDNYSSASAHDIVMLENCFVDLSEVDGIGQAITNKVFLNFYYDSTIQPSDKTKSLFKIGNRKIFIVDFYHDPDQFDALEDITDNFYTQNLLSKIDSFLVSTNRPDQFDFSHLLLSFLQTCRKDNLDSVFGNNQNDPSMSKKISKHLSSKLSLYDKQIRLAHQINFLFKYQNFNKMEIASLLKIPYSFVQKICRINDPVRSIMEQRQSFLEFNQRKVVLNNEFLNYFRLNTQHHNSLKNIYNGFLDDCPLIPRISKSKFFRDYIKGNDITFKKSKIKNISKNEKFRNQCRVIFLSKLIPLLINGDVIYFFDESTFEFLSNKFYAFSESAIRPIKFLKFQPIYLKLFMVVTINKIECFQLTFSKTTGDSTYRFLKEFIHRKKRNSDNSSRPITVIMDNSPKNRIQKIKKLAIDKEMTIFYTVPTTPFTNFIENIFNILKKKVALKSSASEKFN